MKNWERKIVPAGMALAGVAFLVAAFKPAFTALPLNVTFLLVGIASLAIGVAIWRKSAASPGS